MKVGYRIGIGFDAHRFAEKRKFILGGVTIKYEKGLLGHSDADVLCHAIADALLGAIGQKDIGQHFPDSDKKFKDISSLKILSQVLTMITKLSYKIINIDAIIICQTPKLNPYFSKMKKNLAKILRIREWQIGLKAKTTEGMGFIGQKQGVAAYAIALVEKTPKDMIIKK